MWPPSCSYILLVHQHFSPGVICYPIGKCCPLKSPPARSRPDIPTVLWAGAAAGFCLPAAMRKSPSPRDAKPAKGSVHITPRRGWILVPRFGQRKLGWFTPDLFINHILHSHVENTKQIPIRNKVSIEDELNLPSIPNTSTKPHHLPTYCVSVEGLVTLLI